MTYTETLYRALITLPVKSGITRDYITNSLHYSFAGTPTALDFTNLTADISHFYTQTPTGGTATLSSRLGAPISTAAGACTISYYALPVDGSPAGPPVSRNGFTMTAVSVDSLPEECAVTLSFEGDQTGISEFGPGTRPRSRRRNRIYLGPIGVSEIALDSTTKRTRVRAAMINDVQLAAKQNLYQAAFGHSWNWRVVSHKAVEDHPVFFVAVDDTFDTQRRRGPELTAKTWLSVV